MPNANDRLTLLRTALQMNDHKELFPLIVRCYRCDMSMYAASPDAFITPGSLSVAMIICRGCAEEDMRLDADPSNDPRVIAIRNDPTIGRGTCSTVDECIEDSEIVSWLEEIGITTPDAALAHFIESESVRNEVEDDIRGYGDLAPLHSPLCPNTDHDTPHRVGSRMASCHDCAMTQDAMDQ